MDTESPRTGRTGLNGAELTIALLRHFGIDTLFALSGNGVLGLFDAALDFGVRIVDTRHESAAVQAAGGLALLRRTPQACIVTEGPGLSNALGGIAGLHHDGIPVVVITNCPADDVFGSGVLQEMPQVEMTAPISKWAAKVHDIRHLPSIIERAFRVAAGGIPGPVVITLANQVLGSRIDASVLDGLPAAGSGAQSGGVPSAAFVGATLALLAEAEKPLIVAGAGAFWDGADEALARFAESSGIPVATCSFARGLLPDTHPCCVGEHSPGLALPALKDADAVLVLGERIDHLLAFGRCWASGVRIAQVCAELTRPGRSAELASTANCRAVMEALLSGLGEGEWPRGDWLRTLKEEQSGAARRAAGTPAVVDGRIHPAAVGRALQQVAGPSRISMIDGVNAVLWARESLPALHAIDGLGWGRLAMIGMGLPATLGIASAKPAGPVILLTGDGSLGFHLMEFETAIRHSIPLLIVVLNDAAWGIEQHFQRAMFGRLAGTTLGEVRYDAIAATLGGFGALVERPEELAAALRAALADGRPAIVNVRVANVAHPRVAQAAQMLREHGHLTQG